MNKIETRLTDIKNANQHFEEDHVANIEDVLQKRYAAFAERINESGGCMNIELSIPRNTEKTIHFEARIENVPKDLKSEITHFEINNPNVLPLPA